MVDSTFNPLNNPYICFYEDDKDKEDKDDDAADDKKAGGPETVEWPHKPANLWPV